MTTQEAARLMKLAKVSQKIAMYITAASIRKGIAIVVNDRKKLAVNDERLRKYCRWSHATGYAMQLCLEGIQARAKYQSTYVTAG
jgi:hypothetical protein